MEKNMENSSNYPQSYQQSEIIQKIERLGGKFNLNSALSIEDQLFICESLANTVEPSGLHTSLQERRIDSQEESVSVVKWSDSDTYKRRAIPWLIETKRDVIEKLKLFNYETDPIEIASALQTLFVDYPSDKEGHWLYTAQHWNPRAINRVIDRMIKLHSSGRTTIQNPAGYFTRLIKFRKQRRSL